MTPRKDELDAHSNRLRVVLDEQRQLLATERSARSRAEAALRARDDLVIMATHELRTPLATIKISADMMRLAMQRAPLTTEEGGHFLDAIGRSSDRLASMLTDLLDTSSVGTEGLRAELERVDLAGLARTVARGYQEGVSRGSIACQIPSRPTWVLGDAARLEQVLDNLLGKALKYSPAGGEVILWLRSGASGALLSVQDTGIGVPSGDAERIFEPFQRAPNAIAHGAPGLGLGLHISRQIAEAHGGTLWAKSPGEGRGATLTLWLPTAAEPVRGVRRSNRAGGRPARAQPRTVAAVSEPREEMRPVG